MTPESSGPVVGEMGRVILKRGVTTYAYISRK